MKKTLTRLNRNGASINLLESFVTGEYKILDCGSRDGALLRTLGEKSGAKNLVALDFHNRVENGVTFLKHNLETRLPFEDGEFDVVICNDVLEHVENKNALFSELLRVCRGHVLISLPNTQYWRYIVGLARGRMSKQYNFLVNDGVDRHRWITYYGQNIKFVENSQNNGSAKIYNLIECVDSTPDQKVPLFLVKRFPQFFVFNQLFLLKAR